MAEENTGNASEGGETEPVAGTGVAPQMAENSPHVEDSSNGSSLGARIRAIEARHGKEFTEVLVDLHDHVFGKT